MKETKKTGKYRCPFCGSESFIGHQIIRADVGVGSTGEFEGNLRGGLEAHIYDAETPYGPFTCRSCDAEFDNLPEAEYVSLPRGCFSVVRGDLVVAFKNAGYGYHHQNDGFTVIGNGTRAVAVTDEDYDKAYNKMRSFMI